MVRFLFRLYVSGKTPRTERALRNLTAICEEFLSQRYRIEVIDVLKNPEEAEVDSILATPTLVRAQPQPIRRLIGDLSDRDQVLRGLGLDLDP